MLSARYLASVSDSLVSLYSQLESDIKNDMFTRLARLQKITDATEYQARSLLEIGALKNDIYRYISKYNALMQPELERLYNEALDKAEKEDVKRYTVAQRDLSENQAQAMKASVERFHSTDVINKTFATRAKYFEALKSNLVRMTMTVADESEKQFIKECNNAYMKVSSGSFSYQQAYKEAVINLANNGVRSVQYTGSGKPITYTIEAACRMNVVTGINQTASIQTLSNCETLGCDLVEVSAHVGARDRENDLRPWANHAKWQGKVFCLNGERDYIDGNGQKQHAFNFQESCGVGEPDGICGINCRHSYYPYFEGTNRLYDRNQLDELKEERVNLNGKKVSVYEAEQELRKCERNIRKYKTIEAGLEATGNKDSKEYKAAAEQVREWQASARSVCKQTGITRDYSREYVANQ